MREKFQPVIIWLKQNPKKVYLFMMSLLIISFVFAIFQYIYFPPKIMLDTPIPKIYSKSEEVKNKGAINEIKQGKIVKELLKLKAKKDSGNFSEADKLRVDYLLNQYQNLKNGH